MDPKARDFFVAATFVMVAGFIVSLGAALTGFMDWWKGIPRDRKSGPIGKAKHTQVWRTINWHATVMLTVTAITLLDIILRVSDFERGQTSGAWLVLSLLAGARVTFGAAYGGTLVFEYGFNVENVEEVWNESEEDHVRLPRRRLLFVARSMAAARPLGYVTQTSAVSSAPPAGRLRDDLGPPEPSRLVRRARQQPDVQAPVDRGARRAGSRGDRLHLVGRGRQRHVPRRSEVTVATAPSAFVIETDAHLDRKRGKPWDAHFIHRYDVAPEGEGSRGSRTRRRSNA